MKHRKLSRSPPSDEIQEYGEKQTGVRSEEIRTVTPIPAGKISENKELKIIRSVSQNPHTKLSSNMYKSFRLFRLERLHCTPNDARLTVVPKVGNTVVWV